MAWVTISSAALQPGQFITSALGLAYRDNCIAIADGDVGAPKVAIDLNGQTAIGTDELDPTKTLVPDGLGGVAWSSSTLFNVLLEDSVPTPGAPSRVYDVVVGAVGTWVAHFIGSFGGGATSTHGICTVINGVISNQSTIEGGTGDFTTKFSVAAGVLSFTNNAVGDSKGFLHAVRIS